MMHFEDQNLERALNETASRIGVLPWQLFTVIYSESRWNPKASNPKSSAKGLIGFIDSTAQGLGYKSSQDLINKHPSIESQLRGPVLAYFTKVWKVKPNNLTDMVGVLFYPKFRNEPNKLLPESVRKVNPGINTLNDYANIMVKNYEAWRKRNPGMGSSTNTGVSLLSLGLIGYVAYYLTKKWRER
jgi:hypothetical protein